MGAVRSCVCLLVIFVHLQVIMGKPILDWLLCDCDDDDFTTTRASTQPNFLDLLFDCPECPPPVTRPPQSIAIMMPATNGMALNVTDTNGVLQMILNAMAFGGQAQTTAAPATPPTTAAPANATAA